MNTRYLYLENHTASLAPCLQHRAEFSRLSFEALQNIANHILAKERAFRGCAIVPLLQAHSLASLLEHTPCLLRASHQAVLDLCTFEILKNERPISHRRERLSQLRNRSTTTGPLFDEVVLGDLFVTETILEDLLGKLFVTILK